ncbi:MAG: endonuclease/exonuclease/phosphatase family protein [Ardenticatenales bacterium]|nr:endonuclease/exonuclease/phosphatase family protein [Ardenticatenales bacterium]
MLELLNVLFNQIIILFVWLLAGALLFSQLARYSWLADLAASFRSQQLILLAGGLMLALGRRLYGTAGLATILFLSAGAVYWPYMGAASGGPAGSPDVTILSHNVYIGNRDFAAIRAEIEAADADLVLLMEATPELGQFLAELADYPYRAERTDYSSSGLILLSRYPFSLTDDPFLTANLRSYFLAEVAGPAGPFRLLGTHTFAPVRPYAWALRNDELPVLAAFASAQTGPLVIAGDLNVASSSPHFQEMLATGALQDGRSGQGLLPSWPAAAGRLAVPIDHVLTRGGVTVRELETLAPAGSDHRPLLAGLHFS